MARQIKRGLEYFPLDVVQDDDVALLEYKCGLEGFGILIKLWQKIYANSYYTKWNDSIAILFCRNNNCTKEKLDSVIEYCIQINMFDKHILEKYQILTSSGIQKRYLMACNMCKRKNIHMFEELVLVDEYHKTLIHELTPINSGIPPELGTQSKVKERKVNKKKEKYGEFVWLFNEEHDKLIEKFGSDDTKDRIERLDLYIGSKGDKYKSHYHTILSWYRKDQSEYNNGNSKDSGLETCPQCKSPNIELTSKGVCIYCLKS
jgi:hypothetical protein